jgi:pimeloyl-ACP methyl ester carboxylesterase
MLVETDLTLADGRTLHVYDRMGGAGDRVTLTVFWHHGTPNLGAPPEPLFELSDRLGVRWISYDRPGYGGSSPDPDRTVGSAATDVAAIADTLGIEKFAVMGHSGGGPHVLACAALLPGRITAVASLSAPAPVLAYRAEGLDYFAGMYAGGAAELRASAAGRAELAELLAQGIFDREMFHEEDWAALAADWAWMGRMAEGGMAGGPGGMIDDDLAYVRPWGFEVTDLAAPVLIVQGDADRVIPHAHGEWLARHCPGAEFWSVPGGGHITVLRRAAAALEWLVAHTEH